MTRYEYNFALQDLLGLPYDFARDLPPETPSKDGFANSAELLQITSSQFETYREIARQALLKATVRGEQPRPVYYSITFDNRFGEAEKDFEAELAKVREQYADDPKKLEIEIRNRTARRPSGPYYENHDTGGTVAAKWAYHGARYAWKPIPLRPKAPPPQRVVATIPTGKGLIVDLGDHLPDTGMLLMRIRASSTSNRDGVVSSLRPYFGQQASNDLFAEVRVGETDLLVPAKADGSAFVEIRIPLSEVIRNPFRGVQKLGDLPNPAEFVKVLNHSDGPTDIRIDYIEVVAPVYDSWPPESHRRVFPERANAADEAGYVREVLRGFMTRAWRRPPTDAELGQKMAL